MKILVISLLRLGDILMQKPLLKSMQQKYPGCEIHFLIHREFQMVESFLPEVKAFHFFERQEWSRWINQVEVPLLKPVKSLGTLIQTLNSQKFDMVWNWTHQSGSAYLMELIQAQEKRGLQSEQGRIKINGPKELKNFNDTFTNLDNRGPHYLEHLSAIFQLPLPRPLRVRESLHPKKENLICVQALTSDIKKNWELNRFRQWLDFHQRERPQDKIVFFGAPNEKEQLSVVFPAENLQILTLPEVAQLLRQADLLISVDTAIKHLAVHEGVRVLELAFGSAQPSKTGPWAEEFYHFSPRTSCWPCSHSKDCSQPAQYCAKDLSPNDLHLAVMDLIHGRVHRQLKKITNENSTFYGSGGTHVERNGKLFITSP